MEPEFKKSLRDVGVQLDRNQYPRIYNGGVVKPGDTIIETSTPGKEISDEKQRKRRSTTKPWERAVRRQGSTCRSRSSNGATPIVNPSLREAYEAQLIAVREAYPDTVIWQQDEGLWLLTESTVLPGLGKKATFLIALPFSEKQIQRSWGFWTTPTLWEWIGPRHTNFPDGSICAFEPQDNTWFPGGSIVKLLDFYTLWALRHEHLKLFGRWPGQQSVQVAYERIEELKDDEYCGCNKSGRYYKDCCKENDISRKKLKSFLDFYHFTQGNIHRYPPLEITNFISKRKDAPAINSIYATSKTS